jgi:hypothetical protein
VQILRVFDRISKQYQRLGYLKRLIKRVTLKASSNLDVLGNDLVDTVMHKVKYPLTNDLSRYIKVRLFDNAYKSLKEQANHWTTNGGDPPLVQVEIQDLYLSDLTLPSSVGKLVKDDWRFYPPLGINLGLIRSGSYSATTRALSLIPEQEHQSFHEFIPVSNPFKINVKQALLFLYSFIENDGEVIFPLLQKINTSLPITFNDRQVGDFLPEIYRSIINRYRKNLLSIEVRERLDSLEKSAESIAAQTQKQGYAGGTSREHASRPRIEPFVDIGFFTKNEPMRYEYSLSPIGLRWANSVGNIHDSFAIEDFLTTSFFKTVAESWEISATLQTDINGIVQKLRQSAKIISSSSGYTPIEELALLAGIESLVNDHQYFEINTAREALLAYQKSNPYEVRFTVDRMGKLAHSKFVDDKNPIG